MLQKKEILFALANLGNQNIIHCFDREKKIMLQQQKRK